MEEKQMCTYECEECGDKFSDVLYFEENFNGHIRCQECRKFKRYSHHPSTTCESKDGEWVKYSDFSVIEDCLQRIQLGCSFPSTDIERAIRDTARQALSRVGIVHR